MNDTRLKILICDDENNREQHWQQELESVLEHENVFDVQVLPPDDLLDASIALEARRRIAREEPHESFPKDAAEAIDTANILIVDYDLLDLRGDYYQTGEGIAYLARCYSSCGLIVALNQFDRGSVFDLSLVPKGFPHSFADINISSNLLANRGLWSEPWEGFRPWQWPLLPQALEKFEARCKSLDGNLEQGIFNFLSLPQQIIPLLPRELIEWIGGKEATFEQFVRESGAGLHKKDKPLTPKSIVRIAAARVWQWLEWGVLPTQTLLIDAPHLITAFPSIVSDRKKDIDTWNRSASFVAVDRLPLNHEIIEPFRFIPSDWVSRPVWFWPLLKENSDIEDVADPWSTEWSDHVFCEDTSRFVIENEAREFTSALSSQFSRRYVEFLAEGIEYQNRYRFSL